MPAERAFWTDAAWESLPLVLAGPILRRADEQIVSVWLAARRACTARVRVFAATGGAALLEGEAELTKLGQTLFVGVVVARPSPGPTGLRWGETYQVVTEIREGAGSFERLPGLSSLAWGSWDVPTLRLPPRELGEVRIAHGSCRKVHGGHRAIDDDGLRILDLYMELLPADELNAKRPQMLFLTGDQVYADDLPLDYLRFVQATATRLLGNVSEVQSTPDAVPAPGQRGLYIQKAGFTAGVGNDNAIGANHLVTIGEFYAHYLLAWSSELWSHAANTHNLLQDFQRWTSSVRRVLANVPTYMSADDHEVTDDWYMNEAWVWGLHDAGRDIITNALVAFALFQAWGNDPLAWERAGSPGRTLLDQVGMTVRAGSARPPWRSLAGLLGVPAGKTPDLSPLEPGRRLAFHFAWRGAAFEVVGLDTRTWRAFPPRKDGLGAARLLSRQALRSQIPDLHPSTKLTLLISPAPVFLLWFLDWVVERHLIHRNPGKPSQNARYAVDYEGWNHRSWGCQAFLQALAARNGQDRPVVALSGDVHHGYAVEVDYRTTAWLEEQAQGPGALRLIQLVSSACRNQEMKALAAGGATDAAWLSPINDGLRITRVVQGQMEDWGRRAREAIDAAAQREPAHATWLAELRSKIDALAVGTAPGRETLRRDLPELITSELEGQSRGQVWVGRCSPRPRACDMLPCLAWDMGSRGVPTTWYALRYAAIDTSGGAPDGAQPDWLRALATEIAGEVEGHEALVETMLSRSVMRRLLRNLAVSEPHVALVSFPGGRAVHQDFVLARQSRASEPTIASLSDIPFSRTSGS